MDYREILDILKKEPALTAWEMTRVRKTEHQLYVTMGETESERTVQSETVDLHLYLERMEKGEKVLGESRLSLGPQDDFKSRISRAAEMAGLVSNQPFALPGPGGSYLDVKTFDQELAADPKRALAAVHREIEEALPEGQTLSCAEIVVTAADLYFMNSLGLELDDKKTKIFADFVLLTGEGPEQEVESHGFKNGRMLKDLQIGEMVKEYGAFAVDTLSSREPPTGTFDVVFSHEALDTFFSYFKAQAGGPAKHQGWSRFQEGEPIVKDVRGDLLTLSSDPTLDGGMESGSFDADGLPLSRVDVIKAGIFQRRTVDSRYGSYLELAPTGSFTNVVVAPGSRSFEELLKPEPLLHLLKFSVFEPRPVTGAFSGEIRVGYLLRDGKKIPLKGGSVSGVMDRALEEIYFSQETEKREAYLGPRGVKVTGLKIAGE